MEVSDWRLSDLRHEFQLHGRFSRSFVADFGGGTEPVLSAVELLNALGGVAEIQTKTNLDLAAYGLQSQPGWPAYVGTLTEKDGATRLQLEIELRFSPHEFPEQAASCRERAQGALLEASPSLTRHVGSGAVKLEILLRPPGALGKSVMM